MHALSEIALGGCQKLKTGGCTLFGTRVLWEMGGMHAIWVQFSRRFKAGVKISSVQWKVQGGSPEGTLAIVPALESRDPASTSETLTSPY